MSTQNPQEYQGLSIINETQRERNVNSPIIEEDEESFFVQSSNLEVETPRYSLKRPSTYRFNEILTEPSTEESFQLSNSILEKVASTPYVSRQLSNESTQKELTVVVKKIRLSEDEIQEFSRQYSDWTSLAGSSQNESTITGESS